MFAQLNVYKSLKMAKWTSVYRQQFVKIHNQQKIKMKFFIAFAALVAVAVALPAVDKKDAEAEIIKLVIDADPVGNTKTM